LSKLNNDDDDDDSLTCYVLCGRLSAFVINLQYGNNLETVLYFMSIICGCFSVWRCEQTAYCCGGTMFWLLWPGNKFHCL